MNLLVLSSWFPYPADNGSRIRAYFLLRELVRAGHRVRLVAGLQSDVAGEKNAGVATLQKMGVCETVTVPWQWYDAQSGSKWGAMRAAISPVPRSVLETPNPALTRAIAAQLTQPTDLVLVLETGMDAYLPSQMPPHIPMVLDGAELSSPLPAKGSAKARLSGRKSARYQRSRLRRYAALSVVSADEAEAAHSLLPAPNAPRIVVIPNGVDCRAYPPRDADLVQAGRLLYNGSPTYGPNREAALWFVQKIFPRLKSHVPEAHFWVTGRHGAGEAVLFAPFGAAVHLTGFVPDLRPVLASAAVCVVPLLKGGGTRLKILEAWAAGVPVVSTSIGARGLGGAVAGAHFLRADTPEDFADATLRLLQNKALCQTLSDNARALARDRYDWERIGASLNNLLVETCQGANPS